MSGAMASLSSAMLLPSPSLNVLGSLSTTKISSSSLHDSRSLTCSSSRRVHGFSSVRLCSRRNRNPSLVMVRRAKNQLQVVAMAPEEEKLTRRNPLDFPIEWERPKPGRRPDIFPKFSPMKTPLPPPMPYDPPEEDEEEEEKKEEEEENPDNEEEEQPENRGKAQEDTVIATGDHQISPRNHISSRALSTTRRAKERERDAADWDRSRRTTAHEPPLASNDLAGEGS